MIDPMIISTRTRSHHGVLVRTEAECGPAAVIMRLDRVGLPPAARRSIGCGEAAFDQSGTLPLARSSDQASPTCHHARSISLDKKRRYIGKSQSQRPPKRTCQIFLDKNRRYIGKSQSQRPPKRTQRRPGIAHQRHVRADHQRARDEVPEVPSHRAILIRTSPSPLSTPKPPGNSQPARGFPVGALIVRRGWYLLNVVVEHAGSQKRTGNSQSSQGFRSGYR
jgi:hypothetical protein